MQARGRARFGAGRSRVKKTKQNKTGELEGGKDPEGDNGGWEDRCGRRGSQAREAEEEVDPDLEHIAGCYPLSRGWLLQAWVEEDQKGP